jgi:nitroreductase
LYWEQDCSAAMENLLLAAVSLGLGGVWIGVHPSAGVEEKVRRILGIPQASTPLGLAMLGHPAEEKSPRTRFKSEKVHWQSYGQRFPEGEKK